MWQETLTEVEQLKDMLGLGMDSGIIELVTCLRMLGLKTIMSCEGHSDRQTAGPYVMFRSPDAPPLEKRYWKLAANGQRKGNEANNLRDCAYQLNLRERQKLTPLLDEFYSRRPTRYDNRIVITTCGLGGSRIQCHAAEEFRLVEPDKREDFLRAHQQEFTDFTTFLKAHLNIAGMSHD